MAALYYSLSGRSLPEGIRIVEKSVENAEFAYVLRNMFPDNYFIHIVRNPYATIVSLRKARSQSGYPVMDLFASSLKNSYYYLFKNRIALDRYLVICYEDLISQPEATMKQVVDFLGIGFDEGLLHPTSLGEPWGGNSTSNRQFNGISTIPLEGWKEHINDYEISLVNNIADPIFEAFGYERLTPSFLRFFPVKREGLATYAKNRITLRFNSKLLE
jgi:hypothetical protein